MAITGCALGALVSIANLLERSEPANGNYPEMLFRPLPVDGPRLFSEREPPSPTDKAASAEYRKEQLQIREYLKTRGCERDVTAEEREALDAAWEGKLTRARDLAEQVLRVNNCSIAARFVRAQAFAEGEANPGSALHELCGIRGILEAIGRSKPDDMDAREWYVRVLSLEGDILVALDRDEECLQCLRCLESVYRPLPWRSVLPLIRLKRYDEAEARVEEMNRTGRWASDVLNARALISMNRLNVRESHEALRRLVELNPDVPVFRNNLAEASVARGLFAEAEEQFRAAGKLGSHRSNSPYTRLAALYTRQGRFAEAVAALTQGRIERSKRHPSTWPRDQGRYDEVFTWLALTTGHLEQAESTARRAARRQDRQAASDIKSVIRDLRAKLTLATVLRCRAAEDGELAAVARFAINLDPSIYFEQRALELEVGRELNMEYFIEIVTPNTWSSIPGWQTGELLRVLPYGSVKAALNGQRSSDPRSEVGIYYDALAAEAAHNVGRADEAERFALQALAGLSEESEKLLCAKLRVIVAAARMRVGDTKGAVSYLEPVLDIFPAVLRLLDVGLPVRIETDGSEVALECSIALARSPRLRADQSGLPLHIAHGPEGLMVDLFRSTNSRLFQVSTPIEAGRKGDSVREIMRRFHAKLATPKVALDQATLTGLDGSPFAEADDQAFVAEGLRRLRKNLAE